MFPFAFFLFFTIFATSMTKRFYVIGLLCLLFGVSGMAQEKSWLLRALGSVKTYIDSSAVKGIDREYIGVPKQPWQVMAKYNLNQMSLKMNSHFGGPEEGYELNLEPHMKTQPAHNVGFWIGYRGYGIGYSVGIGPKSGSYFTAGVTGSSYGLNLRLRTFSTDQPELHMWGKGLEDINNGEYFDLTEDGEMDNSIRVRSLIIDGYYLFNGKRFSYMAAYDQSALQLRSAGSFLVGAMWHQTTIRYNSDRNAAFIALMHSIGVQMIRQGNIGAGYSYNWVPFKGMLINALVMPMLTVYNNQKVDLYDCYVDDSDNTYNDRIEYRYTESKTSNVTVTVDARLSLTYNWDRCFINAYGQWNRFRYDHDEAGKGSINDWFINASIGYRF